MAARTARKGRLTEYMVGPEPGGIRECIRCGKPIRRGEMWVKRWAPGGAYSVGTHAACEAQSAAKSRTYELRACSLCGYTARDGEGAMAGHLAIWHRIRDVAALIRLAA
jgi:hypothetical protein